MQEYRFEEILLTTRKIFVIPTGNIYIIFRYRYLLTTVSYVYSSIPTVWYIFEMIVKEK